MKKEKTNNEKSIIDELFHNPISRAERCTPESKEYDALLRAVEQKESFLLQSMSDENKKLFEDYMEFQMDKISMEIDEAYRQGVSFGVCLTSEAFLVEKGK